MFRYEGDTNTTNSSQRFNPSQANSAVARAEQCLKDDRFYNLLYKNYDTRCLDTASRSCHRNDAGVVEGTDSPMDAARPRTCKQLDSTIATVGEVKPQDTSAQVQAEAHAGRDFKLVGTGLPTTLGVPSPMRVTPPHMDFQLAGNARARQQRFPDTLGEVSYGLPPVPAVPAVPAVIDGSHGQSHVNAPNPLPEQPQQPEEYHTEALPLSEPYKCPVCLKCVRQRKPASTICGHVFCSSCIRTALRTTCKCPVCQRLMTTRQIFRIFI